MKTFHCSGCGMMVFFENNRCVHCGRPLGFLADTMTVEALEEHPDNQWSILSNARNPRRYRKCQNEIQHGICNWMVSAGDQNLFCRACRLNDIIPDLSVGGNLERWRKLENAKKRCLHTLMYLGLTSDETTESRPSPRFRFLANPAEHTPIATGHQDGVITVNVAEADDDERERRRLQLHEPYRTLVGHLRHELGHFYWDQWIANSPRLKVFRELFGDETADYPSTMDRYYRQGPAADWPERTVTAYASSHPWEDWAETWAHFMHIYDTLQSAESFELWVGMNAPSGPINFSHFDDMLEKWLPLSRALNAINRGMGLPDLYPFVIPAPAVKKLRFIHESIAARATADIAIPVFFQTSRSALVPSSQPIPT